MTTERPWIESTNESCKIENCIFVECIAEIRNNLTGEVRLFEVNEVLAKGNKHPDTFIWEEGNYSCDCNRLLFFKRANDEETKEDWEVECSEGRFSVNLKNKKDGRVYYREFTL